jgi:antitoxin component YwqK of YwqJK toxin-antitoxin module
MKLICLLTVCCLLFPPVLWAQGEFVQYRFENGMVSSEGTMREGKPDGYWKTYYSTGQIKTEGNRRNFKLDSTWNFYRETGILERKLQYKEDLKDGREQVFDENGKLVEQYTNSNNIRNGEARLFYENGQLKKISQFINGKEEGKATEYETDGRIITLLTYKSGFIYAEERINRYDLQGKRTGIWRDLYEDGSLHFEGNWARGMKNGVFKFFNRKGELDKLERYEDDVLVVDEASTAILDIRKEYHENGNLKEVGTYREGKKQGNFRLYDGNGKESGGLLYDNNVLVGEGMIDSLGRRIGDWKLFYPGGELRAKGSYVEGLKEGPWQFYFASGKTEQVGTYRKDLPTGAWKWYFPGGVLHRDEMYRNGKEDGMAIEYDSLGNVFNEGEYISGAKSGLWKLTVNDHTESGNYLDGERDGVWVWYHSNGKKSFEGEFQSGIPVKRHRYWYPNGQVQMTGSYEGGEMDGRWDYYETNGMQALQLDYKEGQVVRINGQKIKLPKESKEEE